jgi:hypothetical protein
MDPTVSSAANATSESGGEAEIAGGVEVRRGAATRSLRSDCGAAHSGAARHAVGGEKGYDLNGQKDLVGGNSETSNVNGSRPAFWRIVIGVKLNLVTHGQLVVLLRANGEERDAHSSTATRFVLSR